MVGELFYIFFRFFPFLPLELLQLWECGVRSKLGVTEQGVSER